MSRLLLPLLLLVMTCQLSHATLPNSCLNSLTSSRLPEPTLRGRSLSGHVFARLEVAGAYWCARRCGQQSRCESVNYHLASSICQLNDATADMYPDDVQPAPGVLHYDQQTIPQYLLGACEGHTCHPEAVCQPQDSDNYTCVCQNPAYQGHNCSTEGGGDPCRETPCGELGTCVETETPDGFTCVCSPGFTGRTCETVVCESYANVTTSPGEWSAEVELVWRNDAGELVDIYWLSEEGGERYAFSIPAAGERRWPAHVDYLYVARDHLSRALLPLERACSFVIPSTVDLQQAVVVGH